MSSSRLVQQWLLASKDIGFEIVTPFILTLSSDVQVNAEFLVKHYGAKKGMIVVDDYNEIAAHTDEIINDGYGFSVLSEPGETEQYSREVFLEILSDWGRLE